MTFDPLSPTHGDPCDCIRPPWIIWDDLPNMSTYTYSHLQSPFCHMKHIVADSGVQDMDIFVIIISTTPSLSFLK